MAIYSRSFIQILIIGDSGLGKTNALLNLRNNLPDTDKIYLYGKDSCEAKYQYLTNKGEQVGLKHYDEPKAFIEYSNDMQDVNKSIEEYNLGKKRQILIVFDDMITDVINNKKLNPVEINLLEAGSLIFHLSLLRNHILKYQKKLD